MEREQLVGAGFGDETGDRVYALAVSGSDLYAGGAFTTAGGSAAKNIAKWNGSSWSALGSGMNSAVSALAVSGSDLYAGGNFTTAGGEVSGLCGAGFSLNIRHLSIRSVRRLISLFPGQHSTKPFVLQQNAKSANPSLGPMPTTPLQPTMLSKAPPFQLTSDNQFFRLKEN